MKKCEYCTEEFVQKDYRQRFCGRSCSTKSNNKVIGRRHGRAPNETCLGCGATTTKHRLYCSTQCKRVRIINEFLDGKDASTPKRKELSAVVRNFLIEQAGEKCTQCGWGERHEITKRVPLEVDHIDGNSGNNTKDNLRVLCPNCHSLTKTYGALNLGKGRSWRYNSSSATAGLI